MVKESKLKDIEKLSPEERIKKLREIAEQDKEEIEKAQELIKESEDELAVEEKIKHVQMPENQEVDVPGLFRGEEESLEDTVAKEKINIRNEDVKQQQQYLSQLQTREIEQRAENIYQQIQEAGYVSSEQMQQVAAMYQETRQRSEDLQQGSYKSSSRRIQEDLSVTQSITKRILGDFYKK